MVNTGLLIRGSNNRKKSYYNRGDIRLPLMSYIHTKL